LGSHVPRLGDEDLQSLWKGSIPLLSTKMKNKGRRHKAGSDSELSGICNCKGWLTPYTRDITKMGKGPFYVRGVSKKFTKKKWSKRVRGYFKSQTKDII
jgi:hypothetical protein